LVSGLSLCAGVRAPSLEPPHMCARVRARLGCSANACGPLIHTEDSNVENIGSEEDKAARLAAAQTEEEWTGAGQAVGLEIWRVENRRTENDTPDFGVKRWPKEEYGKFFKGDSYILLNTYKKDPEEEKLSFDLHFWIGEESSQDEYGVAAYKAVELDDLLGGDPVQYRETMGHETELFLSYFPNGLVIQSGGIESGFRKVTAEEYKPKLLQVQRNKGQVRAFEVELAPGSMDTSDCFILDAGAKIYVYHGEASDGFEKNKSTALAETMEAERGDGSERVDADEGFWELLGCSEADISSGESTATKPLEYSAPKLYSMHDESHEWVLVKEGPMTPEDLKDDDVMLLDVGSEIYVCVGNDAPAGEKKNAMIKSQNFLMADASKPNFTPLHRVKTGQNPNSESWTKAFEAAAAEPEPAAPAPVRSCACGNEFLLSLAIRTTAGRRSLVVCCGSGCVADR
jgi:gelsolin